jgi:hypothetical protein
MAVTTKRDKVFGAIGCFMITIEETIRNDVMNVNSDVIYFAVLTAYLACVVIASSYLARDPSPIWAAIRIGSVYVIPISRANHRPGFSNAFAFLGTVTCGSCASSDLAEMNLKLFPANQANARNKACGSLSVWLWLMGSIFGNALGRTISRISISPILKLLTAPLTGKHSLLGWIGYIPSIRKPALLGAIKSLTSLIGNSVKNVPALPTDLLNSYRFSYTIAHAGAILLRFPVALFFRNELRSTNRAGDRLQSPRLVSARGGTKPVIPFCKAGRFKNTFKRIAAMPAGKGTLFHRVISLELSLPRFRNWARSLGNHARQRLIRSLKPIDIITQWGTG